MLNLTNMELYINGSFVCFTNKLEETEMDMFQKLKTKTLIKRAHFALFNLQQNTYLFIDGHDDTRYELKLAK